MRTIRAFQQAGDRHRAKPSLDSLKVLERENKERREVVSFIPINPPNIEREFVMQKADTLKMMATMKLQDRIAFMEKSGPIDYVKKKGTGFKKYFVRCGSCGDMNAWVWAMDETLEKWCDLHYVFWHDKDHWHGCLAVNVSPIDRRLGFECACGEDTRDFRANKSLPRVVRSLLIDYSSKHRGFNHPHAKFIATKAKAGESWQTMLR